MKYLWLVVLVVLLVRIDAVMRLVDKASEKLQGRTIPEIQASGAQTSSSIIPFAEDQALKQTPKKVLFSLLNNFHFSPDQDIRERAMTELRSHPTLFTTVLDKDLEAEVYQWRDLVLQKNVETAHFLLDLMSQLQGENYEMIQRFFSLWIDVDLEQFLSLYSKSNDANCSVITLMADPLPVEERLNEFYQRESALNSLLTNEKTDVMIKKYADTCLLMVKVHISKLAPAPAPVEAPVPEGSSP